MTLPEPAPVENALELLQAHVERAVTSRDELLRLLIDERRDQWRLAIAAVEKEVALRFAAAEAAVQAALAAQERATSASFSASGKAVDKAEQAQREYNVHSNEFRGQLEDQAKTFMPRAEASVLVGGLEAKIAGLQTALEVRTSAIKAASDERQDALAQRVAAHDVALANTLSLSSFDVRQSTLQKQVADLRESRSAGQGASQQQDRSTTMDRWLVGLLFALPGVVLGVVEVARLFAGK